MDSKLRRTGILSLLSIVVLLGSYLLTALFSGDFYGVPISASFVLASVYALFVLKGDLRFRISVFSRGAANENILYMVWIFILAGMFAASAKQIGAVDAAVAITLNLIPHAYLPVGIFVASCFVSMAVGTSVGTIVSLTPIITGLAPVIGADVPWMVAIVVGGALFGDNLSFISDTTIAATQSQGCSMRDKFRTNFLIVLPAALLTLLIYFIMGTPDGEVEEPQSVQWYNAIPYLLVIGLALAGLNVLVVLLLGILSVVVIGIVASELSFVSMFSAFGSGISSMTELITVTLLAGGLMGVIEVCGGFKDLIAAITYKVSGRRTAEFSIALITTLTDVCTANNTIAIITVGPIAKNISDRFGIPARKSASVLDIASCIAQGLLPYGAQLLMAAGLAGISPVEIVPCLYYPMLLVVMLIFSIVFKTTKQ